MKRILFSSSNRQPWFENQDVEFHFKKAPYSLGAIGYNLAKRGWDVAWAGLKTTVSPWRLAKKIDSFQPDIVYTYGSFTALVPLFCRKHLCKWTSFRIVHGWDDAYGDIWANLIGRPGRVFMNWMEKRIVTKSDAVVTLSHFLQERGRGWGVDCHYIPNGADPINRKEAEKNGTIKLEGRFNIVYTGDQDKWKRTWEACEAMRHLPSDIKLYLTGQRYKYLDKYASDNCIFLGFVSKEDQRHVMSQADAFVVTADQDCNAKLQEYLRWERPIIGYDGRANLFFKNGRNAILTKDYVATFRDLANNPEKCAELVRNSKSDIPVYSWEEIAGLFEEYFLNA